MIIVSHDSAEALVNKTKQICDILVFLHFQKASASTKASNFTM